MESTVLVRTPVMEAISDPTEVERSVRKGILWLQIS